MRDKVGTSGDGTEDISNLWLDMACTYLCP